MWTWLNSNANAIEAISAVLTVGVTTVLAVITAKYVRLTKTLAHVASAQLQAQAEAAAARRRGLQADVDFLLRALDRPPNSFQQPSEMARAPIDWQDFNFGNFRMLAAEVSPNAGAAAAAVESKTKSLKGSIDQMRLLDTDQSRRPQWESWHNLIIETRNDLNRILSEAQKRTSENAGQ